MFYREKILSIFGVKNFLFIFILLLGVANVFAEDYTIINSIEKNGEQIKNGVLNNFTIGQSDSLTVYFSLKNDENSSNNVIYRIFLTGSSSVPELDAYKNEFYTLRNLSPGEYIFKVQGFINGNLETTPAIIRFSVLENGEQKQPNNETGTSLFSSLSNYGFIAISVLVIALVFIFLVIKNRSKKKNTDVYMNSTYIRETNLKSSSNYNSVNINKNKVEIINEIKETVAEESFDYKYAYESLKKENEKLKNENTSLKGQIDGLKNNVNDLETANSQLAKQKDRLLESKRQVEELHAHKEELFTIALHDIKNPAAAIKGFVELLESYDLNANEQQEIMQSLVDTSSKILELAQEMSVVLAKQTDEPVLTHEKASIKTITDAVCKRNYAYAKNKGINLINNTSPNTPETLIDVNKIEEVIDNLINNSIKYSNPGTIVYVRSFFSESKITIEVEDNGVGLNETDVKKAFRKGVLLSSKPTGDETRSGLGLWISKKIIEDHGGKIWIKSKIGIGTTVGFELPIKR